MRLLKTYTLHIAENLALSLVETDTVICDSPELRVDKRTGLPLIYADDISMARIILDDYFMIAGSVN